MKKILRACALAACLVPVAALAGQGKAGLWEISTQINMGAAMPEIPPEQMEMMKKMGIKMPGPGGDPIVIKQCITKEQAERDEPPKVQKDDSGCKTANVNKSSKGMTADMVCDGRMKGKGTVKVNYHGSDQYSGTWSFKGRDEGGSDVQMSSEFSGKWLGADCGNVKPQVP